MRLKILTLLIIISVMLGSNILFPPKTEAFLGFGDIVFDPANLATNVENFGLNLLEQTYKGLRDQASKRIIDSIVNQTTKWIENGGSPRFVTDWQAFFKNAADVAAGDVIRETSLAPLCSPFKVQLQFALQPTQTYEQQITCTLTGVGNNIENFYKDFSNGGWVTYNQIWAPGGNFYSTYLIASNEIKNRSANAKQAAQGEAQAGGGFLSVKQKGECLEYESADDIKNSCLKQFSDGSPEYESCFNNEWANAKCIKNAPDKVTTPGDIVGKAAANAITSDTEWANNIESWTSLLTNALINRLTKEGVGWLQDQTRSITGGGNNGGTTVPAGYSSATQNLVAQQIKSQNADMINNLQKFIDFDWEYVINLKQESLNEAKMNYVFSYYIDQKSDGGKCELPFGIGARPKSIKSQVKQLTIDLRQLQDNSTSVATRASQLITEINNTETSSISDPEERAQVQQDYSDFISQHDVTGLDSYASTAEREWQTLVDGYNTLKKEYEGDCNYSGASNEVLINMADTLLQQDSATVSTQ